MRGHVIDAVLETEGLVDLVEGGRNCVRSAPVTATGVRYEEEGPFGHKDTFPSFGGNPACARAVVMRRRAGGGSRRTGLHETFAFGRLRPWLRGCACGVRERYR